MPDITDEQLWERWAVYGEKDAFFSLLQRYKSRIIPYVLKMLRGSYFGPEAIETASEFYHWCYAFPDFRRRLLTFNPEKGVKLSTYTGYILRSCWAIFFKRFLIEPVMKKHRASSAFSGDYTNEEHGGLLSVIPDIAPLPDEELIQNEAIRQVEKAAKIIGGMEGYLVEAMHFEALGWKFSPKAVEFIEKELSRDPTKHSLDISKYHNKDDIKGLRRFLADILKISVSTLHVRVFRAHRSIQSQIEAEN